MKTRVQNRNNKRTAIERFDWFIERIQTCVAFVWLNERSGKKFHAWELSRNHPLLRFDVTLLHDWPVERWVLHIRVLFGGKTKRPRFDLFIHWLIKQITNTCRNHFSRSYENCSNLRKQPTFSHATFGFPTKWSLRSVAVRVRCATTKLSSYAGYTKWRPRNERRNSIMMTRHYPDLGCASDWLKQISLAARLIKSTSQN